jgi:tellurite resistance-related uncharacterized protein
MFPKLFFFNFKIPGKIPKIIFSRFENLSLKNSKFQGVCPPLTIFQGKIKIFEFFLIFKMFPPKNISKIIFFNFKIPGKIRKINFSKSENSSLKNSKFQGFFPPLTIFQGKIKFFKFFLIFKMFPPKNVSKIIFFNFKIQGKIPKINFPRFENLSLKIVSFRVFFLLL